MVCILTTNTYKWIVGCLIGIIVILIVYLILKENSLINITFADSLSLASTISSLILSVIAMLYTYYSGRDTENNSDKIKGAIADINIEVQKLCSETKRNEQLLNKITENTMIAKNIMNLSQEAINIMKKDNITPEDKKNAIETMEESKNSIQMFMKIMNGE